MSHKKLATYQSGFHHEDIISKMVYHSFAKTGLQVSLLGFGGATLSSVYNTPEDGEGINTVVEAIKSGVNYIDTAPYYGQGTAEIVLGKALKKIPRNTYYLATKVGRYDATAPTMFDFSAKRTLQSFEESCDRLGVNCIDVLQVHDVEFAPNIDIILNETLPVLDTLRDEGKIKYIGITGYPISKLNEILEKSSIKIDVVLSYCRCTLFNNDLKQYLPSFQERNLAVINAAILGMGLLTTSDPPEWHPAVSEIKETCKAAAKYSQEKKVNISKLAACYSFAQPGINVHLVGMKEKKILEDNLCALFNGLTQAEKTITDEILEKFFKPLSITHWENIPVIKYWEEMNALKVS